MKLNFNMKLVHAFSFLGMLYWLCIVDSIYKKIPDILGYIYTILSPKQLVWNFIKRMHQNIHVYNYNSTDLDMHHRVVSWMWSLLRCRGWNLCNSKCASKFERNEWNKRVHNICYKWPIWRFWLHTQHSYCSHLQKFPLLVTTNTLDQSTWPKTKAMHSTLKTKSSFLDVTTDFRLTVQQHLCISDTTDPLHRSHSSRWPEKILWFNHPNY